MDDYVVAVDNTTKKVIKSWVGDRYRSFDQTKISQYRIAMAKNAADAEARALRVHDQLGR